MIDAPQDAAPPAASALAASLAAVLLDRFELRPRSRAVIGVAGESGSGKSVTATLLAAALGQLAGLRAGVLHQDDYFHLPPRSNHLHRVEDLEARVGPQEVNLALIAAHVEEFRAGRDGVEAPSVDWPNNRFVTRRLDFAALDALVVEGTYLLQLPSLDARVFLSATWEDTRERRRARGRDIVDPVIDRILDIEHRIIARQADAADVVIDREWAVHVRPPTDGARTG